MLQERVWHCPKHFIQAWTGVSPLSKQVLLQSLDLEESPPQVTIWVDINGRPLPRMTDFAALHHGDFVYVEVGPAIEERTPVQYPDSTSDVSVTLGSQDSPQDVANLESLHPGSTPDFHSPDLDRAAEQQGTTSPSSSLECIAIEELSPLADCPRTAEVNLYRSASFLGNDSKPCVMPSAGNQHGPPDTADHSEPGHFRKHLLRLARPLKRETQIISLADHLRQVVKSGAIFDKQVNLVLSPSPPSFPPLPPDGPDVAPDASLLDDDDATLDQLGEPSIGHSLRTPQTLTLDELLPVTDALPHPVALHAQVCHRSQLYDRWPADAVFTAPPSDVEWRPSTLHWLQSTIGHDEHAPEGPGEHLFGFGRHVHCHQGTPPRLFFVPGVMGRLLRMIASLASSALHLPVRQRLRPLPSNGPQYMHSNKVVHRLPFAMTASPLVDVSQVSPTTPRTSTSPATSANLRNAWRPPWVSMQPSMSVSKRIQVTPSTSMSTPSRSNQLRVYYLLHNLFSIFGNFFAAEHFETFGFYVTYNAPDQCGPPGKMIGSRCLAGVPWNRRRLIKIGLLAMDNEFLQA